MRGVTTSHVEIKVHAATIDIVDSRPPAEREGPGSVIVPTDILVDGVPLYVPRDSKVSMAIDGFRESAVAVTMTFFARRLRVGYADEMGGPIGELPTPETDEPALDEPATDESEPVTGEPERAADEPEPGDE
jgi:hypothetical protein